MQKCSEALEEAKVLIRQARTYISMAECEEDIDNRNRYLRYAIKTLAPWPALIIIAMLGE